MSYESAWKCYECGETGLGDSATDARIAAGRHIAAEHPETFERVTGHKPTPERLDAHELMERNQFSQN